jgi:ketosteroid isomerase-like protein
MILDDLLAAASDFDTDRLATLMHPDVRFDEMPNRIAPNGNTYGFDAALAGFRRGRETLASQSYDVHSTLVDGATIAARVTWRGTVAASGQELTAHLATFTQVRDGKIYRHATYDCYEPFSG